MCVHYAHHRCSQRPEEVGQCWDLELKVVMSYPVWMTGTEPESSARAAESSLQPPDLPFRVLWRT